MVADSLHRLAAALSFYQGRGYAYVDCPWFVDEEYLLATCSPEQIVRASLGNLVGSAEQAFISLDAQGKLPKGRYVGYTPCFRREPQETETHRFGFNKVELYQTDDVSDAALDMMITVAADCLDGIWSQAKCGETTATVSSRYQTADGFDLMIEGIEVGSYGRRTWNGITWLYGTGLAEPRLSVAFARKMAGHWPH